MAKQEELQIKYILLSELADKFLDGNPKLHDIGKICESIQRYGFRDPLGYDANLNDGAGGIVEGNGRLESLVKMQQSGEKPPRGIKVADGGEWVVPVLVGIDAKTESEAKAYSLDHNSLSLFGADFTALDMSRMYESESYLEMLEELGRLGDLPLSVDGDDLDLLLQQLENPSSSKPLDLGDDNQDEPGQRSPKEINCECPNCGHKFVKVA